MKKKIMVTDEIGLCTVKIKWQNPDEFICIYPMKIGVVAIGLQSGSRAIIKKQMIAEAQNLIDKHPDFFNSPNHVYKFSVSIKMNEFDTVKFINV